MGRSPHFCPEHVLNYSTTKTTLSSILDTLRSVGPRSSALSPPPPSLRSVWIRFCFLQSLHKLMYRSDSSRMRANCGLKQRLGFSALERATGFNDDQPTAYHRPKSTHTPAVNTFRNTSDCRAIYVPHLPCTFHCG